MASPTLEALKIARETRDRIVSGSIQATSALRACRTICSLLKRERQNEWIDLELNGYLYKFDTEGEMEKALPDYRKTRCVYLDRFNRPIVVADDRFDRIQDFPLGEPIAELEDSLKEGLYLMGPRINLIREKLGVPAVRAHISSMSLVRILNGVNNMALDFLNNIMLELEYANVRLGIFEETRKLVDRELIRVSKSALEKLVATYQKLSAASTPLDYSQIAFACRDIFQDFAEAIFKTEYLRRNEETPPREQTKNKVYYSLRAKLEGKKDRELELLSAQMDYLNAYFDKLSSYVQKQVHPKGFEPTREDANRCMMYTYLIIGDILRFLR